MRRLTKEEVQKSREMVRPFAVALGKNCSTANAARITGISANVLSRWLCGESNLEPAKHDAARAFIDNPPTDSAPKWKDSDRNRTGKTVKMQV